MAVPFEGGGDGSSDASDGTPASGCRTRDLSLMLICVLVRMMYLVGAVVLSDNCHVYFRPSYQRL